MATVAKEMDVIDALVLAIYEADTPYEMNLLARTIRRTRLLEGFDRLAVAWSRLQEKMDCADTRDILEVIAQKKQKAEKEQEERARLEAADIWR